ncbi:Natural resistance-associated macrophage like [Macleaya cordata]|uniref:Natural resistance-associated macrophage like n=1 Tax=Macleaya cordata TaxID=56857 RepID=A0A200QHY1_MACCD|nr:Natural resistance-associated macrophage like [Macleaya cordata]
METKNARIDQTLGTVPRIFQAVGPVLLISMGYIDPGKWAAVVEGGASFGFDLVLLILVINCAAVLCQYLAARVGVVTGKNLAQIYHQEYDKSTCLLFGVQAELSVIISDLAMILGVAHGLNLLLGLELRTCVLLTAIDVVLFPLFTNLLGKYKAEVYFVSTAGLVLLFYVCGVLMSQPEVPLVMNGMLTRFSGESAFVLMSLLGANIMPHNFYLHSSIVQQWKGPPNMSKSALCHDHFVAILCIFSGIYLVNYVLMSSAATFFHSADLVVLTFQDALLLMDQVFRSPIAPIAFFLVLFISSEITAITWNLGGQVILNEFFRLDTPVWLHRTTIRILAIVPTFYCAWNSGAEGIYQLLIFSQVTLAMLLPSSVIPLLRVASSRSIMGALKISSFVEFLTLSTFMGMLGLKIILVVEILFGSSDWVGSLKWNTGSSMTLPYVVLLSTACASLAFLIVLAVTPLKSEGVKPDEQMWKWDLQKSLPEPSVEGEEAITRFRFTGEVPATEELALEKSMESCSDNSVVDFDPETVMDSDQEPQLPACQENQATGQISPTCDPEKSTSTIELAEVAIVDKMVADVGLLDYAMSKKIESVDPVPTPQKEEGDSQIEKDDDEGDTWEPEESSKGVSMSGPTLPSEGPGSFRSLSGKCEEGGTGSGSLSRLCGLGRAARRQLAAILDEFWGQLYDFHGQATQQAKARKLDVLFGQDPKPTASLNVGPAGLESSGYFPSVAGRGPEFQINSSTYDPPKQPRMSSNLESPHGIQTGSSLWSTSMQLLDAYAQSPSRNVLDYGEKRCLRLPLSSEGLDYQPTTVHGYQISSYLARIAAERNSDSLNIHLDSPTSNSPSFAPPNYMDQLSYALSQKPQNGTTSLDATSIQNLVVSRINRLNAERSYYDPCSSGLGENVSSAANTKKYQSLPNISGLVVPQRDSYGADKGAQWDSPVFGPSISRNAYNQSFYSDAGSRAGVPLAFDQLSPSNPYGEGFSVQLSSNSDAKSLWSRQPFEQLFGMAGKTQSMGNEVGNRSSLVIPEDNSNLDLEAMLLQSFRYCVMKLLKLEGSDWLFNLNGGVDEDLIDRVAARERFHNEAETRDVNHVEQMFESPQYLFSDRKFGSALKSDEPGLAKVLLSSVPHCGESCIWRKDLIVSFGVWCIRRILELAIMESRPELWGKYTYVLNRLQGILDPAFSKPRSPMSPCLCLQIPVTQTKRSIPSLHNGILPPAAKPRKGKCTTASTVLDVIKDVEIAVSCRKGRTGTAAGDVAFPKGKENLASVLKRYKRRLSNKMFGNHEGGSGRKA